MCQNKFKHLSEEFLKAMNEIGEHGYQKHGENSFIAKLRAGDIRRSIPRHTTSELMAHARQHSRDYEHGVKHDHFNDLLHQLAAVAFNAMIEAQFAELVVDEIDPKEGFLCATTIGKCNNCDRS